MIPVTLLRSICTTALLVFGLCWTAAAEDDSATQTLMWPDGTRYVGEVLDGKRSGRGTIFWPDGTRFVGSFRNDLRDHQAP